MEDDFGVPPAIRPTTTSAYHNLLNSIYDLCIICGVNGSIIEANTKAFNDLGYPPERLKTMSILEVIAGADGHLLTHLREQQAKHLHTLIEASCIKQNGTEFPAEIAVTELPGRVPPAQCFFIRDVTMRHEAEEQLRLANAQIVEHEASLARQDAIDRLYQEINNPLQILMSLAELQKDKGYAEQVERIAKTIREVSVAKNTTSTASTEAGHSLANNQDWKVADRGIVLLVDDEQRLRELFVRTLREHDPDLFIETTTNGQEAIELFKSLHPGLIIMDVQMPDMDGVAAFRAIYDFCAKERWYLPPVLFCSGFDMDPTVSQIVGDSSYHGFIGKPFTFDKLFEEISKRLL